MRSEAARPDPAPAPDPELPLGVVVVVAAWPDPAPALLRVAPNASRKGSVRRGPHPPGGVGTAQDAPPAYGLHAHRQNGR